MRSQHKTDGHCYSGSNQSIACTAKHYIYAFTCIKHARIFMCTKRECVLRTHFLIRQLLLLSFWRECNHVQLNGIFAILLLSRWLFLAFRAAFIYVPMISCMTESGQCNALLCRIGCCTAFAALLLCVEVLGAERRWARMWTLEFMEHSSVCARAHTCSTPAPNEWACAQ